MRPYLVWTRNYRHDEGGLKVLHLFAHELNKAGQRAYVSAPVTNPRWNTPHREPPLGRDWVAVYPEIVHGNPWNAPHVARYVMNDPGKLGGDKVYDPCEEVFVYHDVFNTPGVPPERVMTLPAVELDIYYDRRIGRRRRGVLYYVGKGKKTRDVDGAPITRILRRHREALAWRFNRAELLVCFDNMSAMVDLARLCGCPVMLVPNGEYTREQWQTLGMEGIGWDEVPPPFDSEVIRQRQLAHYRQFKEERLPEFLRVTQR